MPKLPLISRRPGPLALAALIIVLLLLLRLGWGWYASYVLNRQIDQLRDAGFPLLAEEMLDPVLLDETNAGKIYLNAAAKIDPKTNSPRDSVAMFYPRHYPPFNAEWHQLANASEAAHQEVFRITRRARAFPQSQLMKQSPEQVFSLRTRWIDLRSLANTVSDGAMHAHLNGNDAEALERLTDVVHISECLIQDRGIVPDLVGVGINALAYSTAQEMAPGLRFSESGTTRPATRAHVSHLINRFLDDQPFHPAMRRAIEHNTGYLIEYNTKQRKRGWLLDPLYDLQLAEDLKWDQAVRPVLEKEILQQNLGVFRRQGHSFEPWLKSIQVNAGGTSPTSAQYPIGASRRPR